jgi:hypothetical protein
MQYGRASIQLQTICRVNRLADLNKERVSDDGGADDHAHPALQVNLPIRKAPARQTQPRN